MLLYVVYLGVNSPTCGAESLVGKRLGLHEHRGAGQHGLLDDLVCEQQERLRDREAESLRRLRVDHELE